MSKLLYRDTRRPAQTRRRAFTLVELLVVIGIIAVLIGILLPSLNKARRSAKSAQCQSNMRQIAMALLQYITVNKGHFPPAQINPGGSSAWPQGFSWQTELVRQKYISSPNAWGPDGRDGAAHVYTNSAFYCPEGRMEENFQNVDPPYPTSGFNDQYFAGNTMTESDGSKTQIFTWYMALCRVSSSGNSELDKNRDTPFLYYNKDKATNDERLSNPNWQRRMTLVRRSSEMVMLVETGSNNVIDQGQDGSQHKARRLAARHGSKTDGGTNAQTNMAFFDGHVANFETRKFDILPTTTVGFDSFRNETIFFLTRQRR